MRRDWLPLLARDRRSLRRDRASSVPARRSARRGRSPIAASSPRPTARSRARRASSWPSADPSSACCGEEQGEQAGSSGVRLIIDPIDATYNFVRGIPVFATLLAIEVERRGGRGPGQRARARTRAGTPRAGHGAWQGERRLRVSGVRELAHAQLFHGSLARLRGRVARRPGWSSSRAPRTGSAGSATSGSTAWSPRARARSRSTRSSPLGHRGAPGRWSRRPAGARRRSAASARSTRGSLVSTNGLLHDAALALLAAETRARRARSRPSARRKPVESQTP